jgi:hypothetical protein
MLPGLDPALARDDLGLNPRIATLLDLSGQHGFAFALLPHPLFLLPFDANPCLVLPVRAHPHLVLALTVLPLLTLLVRPNPGSQLLLLLLLGPRPRIRLLLLLANQQKGLSHALDHPREIKGMRLDILNPLGNLRYVNAVGLEKLLEGGGLGNEMDQIL